MNCNASKVVGRDHDERATIAKVDPVITSLIESLIATDITITHLLTSQFWNHVMVLFPRSRILVGYVEVPDHQRGIVLTLP